MHYRYYIPNIRQMVLYVAYILCILPKYYKLCFCKKISRFLNVFNHYKREIRKYCFSTFSNW